MLRRSLLLKVVVLNASLVAIASVLLAVTPVTIGRTVVAAEVVVLASGVLVIVLLNLLILRRVFAPLRRLTALMDRVDPLEPGERIDLDPRGDTEVATLTRSFNSMLDRIESEREASVRRALEAQEDERLRISRELHDGVGQSLTAIAIEAERAHTGADPDARASYERIASWAQGSLDDLRRVARELRPEALDDLGLVNALIALCGRIVESSGNTLAIDRDLSAHLPDRDGTVDLVIYRVAQESLTNVLRHSGATRAQVALAPTADGVALTVGDNGRGLPPGAIDALTGIAGMRERALLVGGHLTLATAPAGGAEVRLEVPLA